MAQSIWKNHDLPRNKVLLGRVGPENPNHPGTYQFVSTEGYIFPDAMPTSQTYDLLGGGDEGKPTPGTPAIVLTTNDGAAAFIVCYVRPPAVDEEGDDPPTLTDEEDENRVAGDRVIGTPGGARIILKKGGGLVLEGGLGNSITLNPLHQKASQRCSNRSLSADGYRADHGRKEPGETNPKTLSKEEWWNQVGPTYSRVGMKHGDLPGGARRELTVSDVATTPLGSSVDVRTKETHYEDGRWHGQGPRYEWGAANEAMVLGNALVSALKEFMGIIKQLRVSTSHGPSGTPLPPTPTQLDKLASELEDRILSTFMFLSKDKVQLPPERE